MSLEMHHFADNWYRPIVVFALCGLHVTEIMFMYASMYVIC